MKSNKYVGKKLQAAYRTKPRDTKQRAERQ
jgi:hypothetical protein